MGAIFKSVPKSCYDITFFGLFLSFKDTFKDDYDGI
jgi:hypothetical protein